MLKLTNFIIAINIGKLSSEWLAISELNHLLSLLLSINIGKLLNEWLAISKQNIYLDDYYYYYYCIYFSDGE